MGKKGDTQDLIKGKRKGRKELRDALILSIRKEIPWVGTKREQELIEFINKKYMELTYNK